MKVYIVVAKGFAKEAEHHVTSSRYEAKRRLADLVELYPESYIKEGRAY